MKIITQNVMTYSQLILTNCFNYTVHDKLKTLKYKTKNVHNMLYIEEDLIEGQSGQLKQVGGSDGVVGGISVIIQFM